MFNNYLITAWRNIIKNGVFSAINIFGLAIGLMSCILIMLFVREESGFDTWLEDHEQIVRLHTAYSMPNQPVFETVRSAGRMMEAIRDYAVNEIETGVRFIQFGITVQKDGNGFAEQATMVDGSFFDVFDLPLKHGSKESSFNKPMDFLITEELALKYFGKSNAIGETLVVCCVAGGPAPVVVTGILADLPDATHLNTDMIVYLQPALFVDDTNTLHTWTSLNVYTYFKLNQGINAQQLQERVDYWMDNESPLVEMVLQFLGEKGKDKKVTDFVNQKIMPVTDLHLHAHEHAGNMGDLTPMGDAGMINTFTVVAGLVLLIACINFMNLSTAKASKRAKEVAMRKVLGATRAQVIIQFLGEAITIVFISLLLALVSVELVLPFYNEVLGKNLQLHLFDTPKLLIGLIAGTVFVGIGAGLYPALYLSGFLPAHTLKGSKGSESGSSNKLRLLLVVFQFATSIVLVVSMLVVYGQTMFVNEKDVGYQSANKMVLNLNGADNIESLRNELLAIPEIQSVVFSSEAPTSDNNNNRRFKLITTSDSQAANEPELLNYHDMDYGFFEAYQVTPLAGRLFDRSFGSDAIVPVAEGEISKASVLLNESALRKLGIVSPELAIGQTLETRNGSRLLTIIGVIPDIYFRSLKFDVRPTAYTLNSARFRVASLSFSTNDLPSLMTKVEAVWKNNAPMQPINLQFLSEMMAAQYQDELVTAQLFLAFALLAIIIACLGLYGLSAFTVERRTKEIGLRKVMGADVKDIVGLLIWQFSKPVLIANIVAWPIAIYIMQLWLENYPYRLDTWWLLPICVAVGVISLLFAWATVGGNAANVARKNPVQSLRYE